MSSHLPKDIEDQINKVDPERLEIYIRMFDRVLLYNLAAMALPKESIDEVLLFWDKVAKKSIDIDSQKITDFLHGTVAGRLISSNPEQSDGEDVRLRSLAALKLAKHIISSNILPPNLDSPVDD